MTFRKEHTKYYTSRPYFSPIALLSKDQIRQSEQPFTDYSRIKRLHPNIGYLHWFGLSLE
ncbi:hypothetical protein EMIT07CA2_50005 [Brevibacillus sp. IT-7CA2]